MTDEAKPTPTPLPVMYLVPEAVLRGVIEYLQRRPYAEVAEAMPALHSCQKYVPPEPAAPPPAP